MHDNFMDCLYILLGVIWECENELGGKFQFQVSTPDSAN